MNSPGKHKAFSVLTSSLSSSFQSLVVSQAFSNSISSTAEGSAFGLRGVKDARVGRNTAATDVVGPRWTQRRSRRRLCLWAYKDKRTSSRLTKYAYTFPIFFNTLHHFVLFE